MGKDILSSHHLCLPRRPLAWGTAFVAVVDFLFDFVAELGVAVFLLGWHDCRSFAMYDGLVYSIDRRYDRLVTNKI